MYVFSVKIICGECGLGVMGDSCMWEHVCVSCMFIGDMVVLKVMCAAVLSISSGGIMLVGVHC